MAEKKTKAEEMPQGGFEEQYEKLEEVLRNMQNPGASLQESFDNYKEGMKLVQSLNDMIDGIEKEVKVLEEEDGEEE
jgi:exodeoxyribonuclease VII small subunit